MEHLGGNIGVEESEEGKGSTFWFHASVRPRPIGTGGGPAQILQAIPTVEKDKLVILIAEDNENYRLFESILRHEYKLVHAWNAREAVDLFNRYTPHLVLMDINMPVMDGYEATARSANSRPTCRSSP